MIDVLEHVDDDVGLLRDYVRRAEPGTRFLISVPAFQFLWSSHDEFLEHRRRYRLSDLRQTVEAAGLAPLRMRYFFGLLFPAAAAMRLAEKKNQDGAPASQLKSAPDWLNKSLADRHSQARMRGVVAAQSARWRHRVLPRRKAGGAGAGPKGGVKAPP